MAGPHDTRAIPPLKCASNAQLIPYISPYITPKSIFSPDSALSPLIKHSRGRGRRDTSPTFTARRLFHGTSVFRITRDVRGGEQTMRTAARTYDMLLYAAVSRCALYFCHLCSIPSQIYGKSLVLFDLGCHKGMSTFTRIFNILVH